MRQLRPEALWSDVHTRADQFRPNPGQVGPDMAEIDTHSSKLTLCRRWPADAHGKYSPDVVHQNWE